MVSKGGKPRRNAQEQGIYLSDELRELFALDAPGRVERIERGLESGSLADAAEEAHRLRGAAATVGFDELGELADGLELALRAQDADKARELVSAIGSKVRPRTVLPVEDDPVNCD